jgi:NPCBM/NEW2 domain
MLRTLPALALALSVAGLATLAGQPPEPGKRDVRKDGPVGAAELATLDGKKLTGEIVSVIGNELTFKTASSEEKFLVTTLSAVTVGPPPKGVEAGKKHTVVELTDGSVFRCDSIAIKRWDIELKLLGAGERTLTVPMRRGERGEEPGAVFAINRHAGDLKLEQDFRFRVRERRGFDLWVTKGKTKDNAGKDVDRLDAVPGTFGPGDAAADTVEFRLEGESKDSTLRMNRVDGMIFNQKPGEAPPALCKVIDSDGNEYVAQAVARTDKGYAVTTVSGIKLDLAQALVSKFDFAAGAVKFLSDLDPSALEESGSDPEHYQRDKTLDKQPIQLFVDPDKGVKETFPKGLTVHAKTMLTYELKGHYKVFRAMAGVEANVETPSQVRLTIDDAAAGVQLFKGVLKKGDKPLDLNLNVQNVDKLKITVESDGTALDLGNQLTLANARVLR